MSWIRLTSLCGFAATVQALGLPIAPSPVSGVDVISSIVAESANVASPVPEGTSLVAVLSVATTVLNAVNSLATPVAIAPEAADGPAEPEVTMITNVLTWLATDAEGNFVSKTSTYINDKADIDWEPSTLTFPDPPPVTTDIDNIPVLSYEAQPTFEEIPTSTGTVARTAAKTNLAATGAIPAASQAPLNSLASLGLNIPFFGIPFAWLALLRGGAQPEPATEKPEPRGSQIGRVEDEKRIKKANSTQTSAIRDVFDMLPTAIADLLKSHPEFNLGLGGDRLPSAIELELLLNLGGSAPVVATYVSSPAPSLILPSAIVAMGGPAVTVGGQRLSLAPEGLIAGSSTIALQAIAPILPTDYAAIITLEDNPITFVKEAGNPGYMYNNEATLTVGGPALTTAGHTIAYNTRGEIVVDSIQTIDPSPVRKVDLAAATNKAGGGPSGANSGNTKGNGRIVGGILIDGSFAGGSSSGSSDSQFGGSSYSESGAPSDPGSFGSQSNGNRKTGSSNGSDNSQGAAAQKAGADSPSTTTSKSAKSSATVQAASSPSASLQAAGERTFAVQSANIAIGVSFFIFLITLFAL